MNLSPTTHKPIAQNIRHLRPVVGALVALAFLAGNWQARGATIVGTHSGSISFDTTTPDPSSNVDGTDLGNYSGLVTGQNGSGVPQFTITTANDTTLSETAANRDTGGAGMAPIGAFTFRDQSAGNPRVAAFDLLGSVTSTLPLITGTPQDMTIFSITGLTFAVREGGGNPVADNISVNILNSANTAVATGELERGGGGLNTPNISGGGIFSGTITFPAITGHLPADTYSVELDMSDGGWAGGGEAFWISLSSAELTMTYTIPEPSRALLLGLGALGVLLRRRR